MINVGVIGLGPLWESRYHPALAKLSQRIRVCAVYDSLAERALRVAEELRATAIEGVSSLLTHPEVRGVLFLDANWHATQSLDLLCGGNKPVFIAGSLGGDLRRIARLRELSDMAGVTLMPEFSRRFTPATSRLHELMATRLGKPGRVLIEAVAPDREARDTLAGQDTLTDFLLGIFDWCRYVIRTAPVTLQATPIEPVFPGGVPGRKILVQFSQRKSGGEAPEAEIRIHSRPATGPCVLPGGTGEQRYAILCENGRAMIEKSTAIEWQIDAEVEQESLTSDRTETEVMLDHFSRRVAGGLIPVADIADVHRAFQMVLAAEEGLSTGQAIDLGSL